MVRCNARVAPIGCVVIAPVGGHGVLNVPSMRGEVASAECNQSRQMAGCYRGVPLNVPMLSAECQPFGMT